MPGGKSPNRYSQEFKEQAVRRVIDNSLTVVQVARELDVNESTLGCWVTDYRKKASGEPLPAGTGEKKEGAWEQEYHLSSSCSSVYRTFFDCMTGAAARGPDPGGAVPMMASCRTARTSGSPAARKTPATTGNRA